jgi:hypothetical protein
MGANSIKALSGDSASVRFQPSCILYWIDGLCRNCPKQHIVQSTVASIITASNALTKNLSAPRTPAASTTVLWKLRQ